jgi:glycosyltransferase involved in cell wall biosynthesis
MTTMTHTKKILIVGHAPWRQTGYGIPLFELANIFTAFDHKVSFLAIETNGGGVMEYKGYDVFFCSRDLYGQDVIEDLCTYLGIDLIVSLFDPFVLREPGYKTRTKNIPWAAWFPIDQTPVPRALTQMLKHVDYPMVFSEWGKLEAQKSGIENARSMPLHYDQFDFSPPRDDDRQNARKSFGLDEGDLTFGFVGVNLPTDRKALREQLDALRIFIKGLPSLKIKLVILTDPFARFGMDLPGYIDQLGIGSNVIYPSDFAKNYMFGKHESVRDFYIAIDCLLHATAAEGFGFCLVEALACGTQVIFNPSSSMTEIVGDVGFPVNETKKWYTPQGGWWDRPTVAGVTDALNNYHNKFINRNLPSEQLLTEQALRYTLAQATRRWHRFMLEVF